MKKLMFVFLFAVALSSIGLADSISSVTTTASASLATTGTNVVITSVNTADSGTVTASQIQLTSTGQRTGGSFSISDPGSPYYYSNVPVSTSGVTKTFTFTAGTSDTYTYQVTATWSGGSKSSTAAVIQFIDPTSLTISGTPSTQTLSQSQSYLIDLTLQNADTSDVLTSYSLSYDTNNFTVTGDLTSNSGTTITAQSTRSFQWNVTMSSCFTGSKSITLALGNNVAAFTSAVTSGNSTCAVTTTTNTTTTTSSSGSSITTNITAKTAPALNISETTWKAFLKILNIKAGEKTTVTLTKPEDHGIRSIIIDVKNPVNNITIEINKMDSKPATVTKEVSGKIYQYMEIIKKNFTDADLNKATLSFQVSKTWINDNKIDKSKVYMNRFDGTNWNKLTTVETGGDANFVFYDADSPGFSVFAITGEKKTAEQPANDTGTGETGGTSPEPNQTYILPLTLPTLDDNTIMIISVVVIIIVIAIIVYWLYTTKLKGKNKKPYTFMPKPDKTKRRPTKY